MNKINQIEENEYSQDYEEPHSQPIQKMGITYDDIMQRLTNQFIKPNKPKVYPSTINNSNYTPQPQLQSQPIVNVKNSKKIDNNSRIPNYVKSYPTNKPINNSLNNSFNTGLMNKHTQPIIGSVLPFEGSGDFITLLNNNNDMLRKIAIHNDKVAKSRSRPARMMMFQ